MAESAPPLATLSGHATTTTTDYDRTEPSLFGPIPAVRPLRTARSSSGSSGRKAHLSAANAPPTISAPPASAESAPSFSASSANGPTPEPPRTGIPPVVSAMPSSVSVKTAGLAAADAAPLAALLIVAIKVPIGMALLLGWAVVGLSVWLPLVVRAVFAFFGAVLYCTLRGLPGPDGAKLHAAIAFYLIGFSKIAVGLLNLPPSRSSACETAPMSEAAVLRAKLDAVLFVFDVLFLLAFWAVALLLALLVVAQ